MTSDMTAAEDRAVDFRSQAQRLLRSLSILERDMAVAKRYVTECELMGYRHVVCNYSSRTYTNKKTRFPREISEMIAAYNYRRHFPEEDHDN